jgi:hypothetical protein
MFESRKLFGKTPMLTKELLAEMQYSLKEFDDQPSRGRNNSGRQIIYENMTNNYSGNLSFTGNAYVVWNPKKGFMLFDSKGNAIEGIASINVNDSDGDVIATNVKLYAHFCGSEAEMWEHIKTQNDEG